MSTRLRGSTGSASWAKRAWAPVLIAIGCGALFLALAAGPAHASLVVTSFGFTSSDSQAGGHPDLTTSIFIEKDPSHPEVGVSGLLKDATVDLPAGFSGDPEAVPQCTSEDFRAHSCPTGSQVGTFVAHSFIGNGSEVDLTFPIYNLVPQNDNQTARFGVHTFAAQVFFSVGVRNGGDYGLRVDSRAILRYVHLTDITVKFWGIPADPSHDQERWDLFGTPINPEGLPSQLPRKALITNPTTCGVPGPEASLRADSYEEPDVDVFAKPDQPLAPLTGCEGLRFDPALTAQPESAGAGAPSGYEFDLELPQPTAPGALASAELRDTTVSLPPGVRVSPAAANGLSACSDAALGLGTAEPVECPNASRLGSVEFDVPALPDTIKGDIYLRQPEPGHLLRLALVGRGHGVDLRIPGEAHLDPQSGRLTATFEDAPQQPFSAVRLRFSGGPRAALVNPDSCGTYTTKTEFTSWSGQTATSSDSFKVDQGCASGGFDPKLRAGTANPVGGKPSPFNLQVTRQDGEQNISRIDATLPEGVLAKLAGVPLCGDAAAASGNCPAGSQIGTTTVAAGAGSNPLYVPEAGKAPTAVYLAAPYKGAPYSLVVKVPAQAGPFDLGTVTVRSGIYVDPVTTAVSVKSDPLPQILEGIPIAYRDVRVEVSRPDFTLNPTSCDPMQVQSSLTSAEGKTASPSARFQATGCGELGFAPKLAIAFKGATHRSAHPQLKATLTMPKGGANIAKAAVTLPKTEFLEQSHIRTICTRVQYAAGQGGGAQCPKASVYGFAKAWSPLLDKPIEGPVYLRSSSHPLPDLVASLDGQIHVDLQGRIDSPRARIRNTFDFLPDAPVSKFVLTMQGGKKGLLVNNTELCKTKPVAAVKFDGQNGKVADSQPVVRVGCGKKK